MDRDSQGQLPASPARFKPLARTKRDDPTFTKADAYALVGRLAAQWGYIGQEGRDDVMAQEFLVQFDGYSPDAVQRAATIAIGKCSEFAPPVGAIKEELRTIIKGAQEPSKPYRSTPDYSQLPERITSQEWAQRLMRLWVSPEYILAREKDKALTAEAFAKAKSLPEDDICFGKRTRAVVAGMEG